MKKGILLIALCLMFAAFQAAQAQTLTFTYQGSLNDNGAPANGNFDFQFKLFDTVSGGSQVGTIVSLPNVPVTNGVFSVSLNFGNQFPGANRFLEISVRQSGGAAFSTLTPRQPLTSSPYSIKSLNAENATTAAQLGGISASGFIQNTTSQQTSSNFNISGQGNANIFDAQTQYEISGNRVFSIGGTDNTFVGISTGASNTTGISNAFFGNLAGAGNTTGFSNSFFGDVAGTTNSQGNSNSFFGRGAGQFNTSGSSNSFFGSGTGSINSQGSNNSFFGIAAGNQTTTGDENTFIGRAAGNFNGTGGNNTVIGALADVGLNNLNNATAIGARALVTQSNSLILGSIANTNGANANTRVGIGTTAPINRLTIGQPETPVINGALGIFNSGGTFMTVRDTTSDIEGLFGADSNGVILGAMSNDDLIFRTGNELRMYIHRSGTVNVGAFGTNDGRLNVNGRLNLSTLPGGGSVDVCLDIGLLAGCSSSIRYKTDIRDFTPGLSLIRQLRPVSFKWKNDGRLDVGLVAEEVVEVEPLLTTKGENGEIEGVKYNRIGVVLVNAVNEQQKQIEALEKQIEKQNDLIEKQKSEIESLKSKSSEFEQLKQLICSQNKTAQICQTKEEK